MRSNEKNKLIEISYNWNEEKSQSTGDVIIQSSSANSATLSSFFFWFPRKINNERSNQNQPIGVWERLQTGIIHLFSRCNCDPVLIYLRLPLFFFSSIAGRVKRIEKKKQEKMMMMMVMMMMMMMKERMKKGRKERKITHSFASFFGFFLWPASAQWRRTGFFLPSFFPYGDPFFFSNFLFGFYFVLPRCRRHCLPRAAMCRVREKKAGLDQSEARIGVLRVGRHPPNLERAVRKQINKTKKKQKKENRYQYEAFCEPTGATDDWFCCFCSVFFSFASISWRSSWNAASRKSTNWTASRISSPTISFISMTRMRSAWWVFLVYPLPTHTHTHTLTHTHPLPE